MLNRFMQDHAVWDPMPLWDGRRYLLYLLAMDRDKGRDAGTFFTRDNAIHVFESSDLATWRHHGVAFAPRTPAERLCAGNPYLWEGRYWFFGSSTIDQYDDNHLDQRLFLAVSDDGIHYREVHDFCLDPDPTLCPHRRYHPIDGRMLFAWRDPWPFTDPVSGRFYLFICTGGERWGRPPAVVVAAADNPAGPYRLEGCATEMPAADDGSGAAILEIERVNVQAVNGKYYLTFSCWRRLVDEPKLRCCTGVRVPLTDSSLYIMEADYPTGPYRFKHQTSPVVAGSHRSYFYGTTFLDTVDRGVIVLGWHWPQFRIALDACAHLGITPLAPGEGARLHMAWSWRQWPARQRLWWSRQRVTLQNRGRHWLDRIRRFGKSALAG